MGVANGDAPGPGEARASCESETARVGVTAVRADDEPLPRGDAEGILAAPIKPSIERLLPLGMIAWRAVALIRSNVRAIDARGSCSSIMVLMSGKSTGRPSTLRMRNSTNRSRLEKETDTEKRSKEARMWNVDLSAE